MFLHIDRHLNLTFKSAPYKNKKIFSNYPLSFTMPEVGRGQDVVGGLRGTVDSSGHTGETPAIRLHYLPALYTL